MYSPSWLNRLKAQSLQTLTVSLCLIFIGLSSGSSLESLPDPVRVAPQPETYDVQNAGDQRFRRDEFTNWFNKYREDRRRLEEANSRNKQNLDRSGRKRGWSATDTSIVIGIFVFCFGVAVLKICCCGEKSRRASPTVQNQTFIFSGAGNRPNPNQRATGFIPVTQFPPSSAPPPFYEIDEDPPPDYFTATATNNLLSANQLAVNR